MPFLLLFLLFLAPDRLHAQSESLYSLVANSSEAENEIIIDLLKQSDFSERLIIARALTVRKDSDCSRILDYVLLSSWPEPEKEQWFRLLFSEIAWNPSLSVFVIHYAENQDAEAHSRSFQALIFSLLPSAAPQYGSSLASARAASLASELSRRPDSAGGEDLLLISVLFSLGEVWKEDLSLQESLRRLKCFVPDN